MDDIHIADPRIEAYAAEHSSAEPPWLVALADETRELTSSPGMMVGPLEGQLLAAIVAMVRPRSVLEIGTFTGYSALAMAGALGPSGRIITCEINEEHAEIAQRHVGASPYADRIDIRVGPAIETVTALDGPFDLVFIDADKPSYLDYYEAVLPKLAPDGVIVTDNVLWSGRVLDPDVDDESTRAIRRFNDRVTADERVDVVILTVRDGVSLVRHRTA